MKITLQNIGRRFNRDWIFKGVDYTFTSGESYAVLGPNGSGKSTLLQVLNGSLAPSTGDIKYFFKDDPVEADAVFKHVSLAAPYLELIEEFTMHEMTDFHFKFKSYRSGMDKDAVINLLNLQGGRNKMIKYFSSGMKQRL
ncbi:MAG: ATP-binding cassette domain-containing protein, partial [Mucilaginibacter sp.]|nr:ATP-binding cassette domain-containing protein [Mucilaginibacter sp.]